MCAVCTRKILPLFIPQRRNFASFGGRNGILYPSRCKYNPTTGENESVNVPGSHKRGSSTSYINLSYGGTPDELKDFKALISEAIKLELLRHEYYSQEVAKCYLDLALVEHRSQDLQKAVSHYKKAIQIYRVLVDKELSESSDGIPDKQEKKQENLPVQQLLADTLSHYGVVLRDIGDLQGSEDGLSEALALKKKLYGAYDDKLVDTMNNLGVLMHLKGNYEEASYYYEDAIRILLTLSGGNPNTPYIALAYYNLGSSFWRLNRLDECRIALSRARLIARTTFGEDSDNFVKIDKLLADTVQKLKEEE